MSLILNITHLLLLKTNLSAKKMLKKYVIKNITNIAIGCAKIQKISNKKIKKHFTYRFGLFHPPYILR